MAGINPVSRNFVGVHIHQRAKILVRRRAMIAFQKVINDIFPVGFDIVMQTMGESQLVYIRRPVADFRAEITRLRGKAGRRLGLN